MALVARCSIQRDSKIVQFDTKNMFGNDTEITFDIERRVEHSYQGKQIHMLDYMIFFQTQNCTLWLL